MANERRIDGEWVRVENIVYDIYHDNKLVVTLNTIEEVWSFYDKKRHEVIAEKGSNWNYIGLGESGLSMTDWTSEGDKLVWWTHYRNKAKNPTPSTGRTPDEHVWNPVGGNRVEIYTKPGKAFDA